MNCNRQQNPNGSNRKDHLDVHSLNLPLNFGGNASLVFDVGWCLPVVWWV
jgi:hypothetical protein